MSVWNFVVTQPGFGEKTVPTPNGSQPNTVIHPTNGGWVHNLDLAYVLDVMAVCGGQLKKAFALGCPSAKQEATKPPEPPVAPPPAFFELLTKEEEVTLDDFFKAMEPSEDDEQPKHKRNRRV